MKPNFTAQTVLTNQSFSHRQLQRPKNEDAPTNEVKFIKHCPAIDLINYHTLIID